MTALGSVSRVRSARLFTLRARDGASGTPLSSQQVPALRSPSSSASQGLPIPVNGEALTWHLVTLPYCQLELPPLSPSPAASLGPPWSSLPVTPSPGRPYRPTCLQPDTHVHSHLLSPQTFMTSCPHQLCDWEEPAPCTPHTGLPPPDRPPVLRRCAAWSAHSPPVKPRPLWP